MKSLLASTCLTLGLLGGASIANAADCGDVTIASMNWQSAEVISNLDKIILNEGYGCNAEITIGDTVPTITSMAEKGQPDIAPEAWIDLLPDVVKKGTDEGRIVQVGSPLPDGGVQGWWIPQYVADAHPDIKTIPDLLKHPELFPDQEDKTKGALLNGPQGWGGTVVTTQLFKAFEGEKAGWLARRYGLGRRPRRLDRQGLRAQGKLCDLLLGAHCASRQIPHGQAGSRRAQRSGRVEAMQHGCGLPGSEAECMANR